MYLTLVRYMTRRCGTTSEISRPSRKDTWLDAITAPPSGGMLSRPETLGRNISRSHGPSATNFRNSQKTGEPASTVRRSAIGLLCPANSIGPVLTPGPGHILHTMLAKRPMTGPPRAAAGRGLASMTGAGADVPSRP
jgi:hypothetical protein